MNKIISIQSHACHTIWMVAWPWPWHGIDIALHCHSQFFSHTQDSLQNIPTSCRALSCRIAWAVGCFISFFTNLTFWRLLLIFLTASCYFLVNLSIKHTISSAYNLNLSCSVISVREWINDEMGIFGNNQLSLLPGIIIFIYRINKFLSYHNIIFISNNLTE